MPTATTRSSDTQPRLKPVSGTKARRQERHLGHRYGRVRREGDEDIVREARSDDEEDSESVHSDEGDSMSQSSAASLPDSHQRSSSRSFLRPDLSNGNTSSLSDPSEPVPSTSNSNSQVFQRSGLDWSDVVNEHGEGLQVVQFDNMEDLVKENKRNEEDEEATRASSRDPRATTKRPGGMSARQVYLKRLENDPAYIPRVGEFWGHDERLLDKDLRSLSGWWRGKWTARGGFSGRGRGSFGPSGHHRSLTVDAQSVGPQSDPVDQTWKHDGYEELSKGDETSKAKNREVSRGRGRGRGVASRGLSHVTRPVRSQSSASQPQNHQVAPRSYGHGRSYSLWGRYEHAWTKHAVTFLFQDVLNKPKNGEDVGIRVKLPGQQRYNVVRIPKPDSSVDAASPDQPPQPARYIVVKLPNRPATSPKTVKPSLPDPELDTRKQQEAEPNPNGVDIVPQPSEATQTKKAVEEALSEQVDSAASQPEEAVQHRSPPKIQLITNLSNATPSPAYSSPSYGPGYQYPMPRPAYPGMQMSDPSMWFDPRMPYGYPTPPPMPGHVYTPPPPAHPVHQIHHHHHSHSHSHPHNFPPGASMATPYYHPSVPMDYSQAAPVPEYIAARPHPERHASRSYAYSVDGVMVDPQTGAPIFAPPKATKVAIRKPENAPSSEQNQKKRASGGDKPVSNPEQAEVSTPAPQYVSQPEGAAIPYHHGATPSSGGPGFWNGFPPSQSGYYYPHGYPMHGQVPEYPFGQPPHSAHPMQPFPPHHYGEPQDYQPPVYY